MRFLTLVSYLFAALSIPAVRGEGADAVDFLEDIRPILAGKCFPCHGPDQAKRKGKLRLDTSAGIFSRRSAGSPVVAPGRAGESLLIEKIESTDDEEIMPPKDSGLELTPAEVTLLRGWVDSGAEWEEHWAYRKPVRPPRLLKKLKPGPPASKFKLPLTKRMLSRMASASSRREGTRQSRWESASAFRPASFVRLDCG